jgi:hypothetical protein
LLSSVFACKNFDWAAIIRGVAKRAFIAFRLNPDLKKQLEEIATAEERSISQICEMLLRKGVEGYKMKGPQYLHRFLSRQSKEDLSQ